jgi:hypothetical protein
MFKSKKDLIVTGAETQSNSAFLEIYRQQIATLPQAQRLAIYEQTLLQPTAIHILPNWSFSQLSSQLAITCCLTIPTRANDIVAAEAASVFYSRNRFELSIKTIPSFTARQIGNCFRPSDLITRLEVRYEEPQPPIGSSQSENSELFPVLSMPRLRSVLLVFPEIHSKFFGLNDYLRPSAWVIFELQKNAELMLQTELRNEHGAIVHITDVTSYLDAPTPADEAAWLEAERMIGQYKGSASFKQTILDECGWNYGCSREELYARLNLRRCAEEQRLQMLGLQDVEMS